MSLINKASIPRDQNVYRWDYKFTYLEDSHRLVAEVYDYLKKHDPLFNRLVLMYEGGYRDGNIVDEIAIHENVIQPKDPLKGIKLSRMIEKIRSENLISPASSYGEKINYTAIYNAIAGARYFSSLVPVHIRSDLGWQGNFYPYYQGYTFSEIPLNAYSRINYKDTIAILSRVEEKHQQAKETLEKMSVSNISSKRSGEIMEKYRSTDDKFEIYSHVFKKIRDSNSMLSRFAKKYISEILEKVPMKPLLTENMIEDMANELKFETIDERYFSSGPIKFKVTIVRAMMPEYYKKQKRSWDNIECWNFSTTTCRKLSHF
ncbi:MAG: hypothetical protein NZ825_00915 [Candidatus Marinimicrobia bacterium]|nr:hypothetical protein [Candidatus Neomarinimicrobiota bacterium]